MNGIHLPPIESAQLVEICTRHHVKELSLFGSRVTDRFRVDSDADFLVSFQSGVSVTFMTLGQMQYELEDLYGVDVDLVPKGGLKPLVRREILASARVLYTA